MWFEKSSNALQTVKLLLLYGADPCEIDERRGVNLLWRLYKERYWDNSKKISALLLVGYELYKYWRTLPVENLQPTLEELKEHITNENWAGEIVFPLSTYNRWLAKLFNLNMTLKSGSKYRDYDSWHTRIFDSYKDELEGLITYKPEYGTLDGFSALSNFNYWYARQTFKKLPLEDKKTVIKNAIEFASYNSPQWPKVHALKAIFYDCIW
jgi:hypothetical protein